MIEKIKILIVEDERIVAESTKMVLEMLGYEVLGIVSSGEKAIKTAEKIKPDLILMDIKLKGSMKRCLTVQKIQLRMDI